MRRITNPLFSQTFLRELEPTIKRYYRSFIAGIAAEANQNSSVVNITKWIDHLAFDVRSLALKAKLKISGAMSLGDDFKALESTECHDMIHRITEKWTSVSKVKDLLILLIVGVWNSLDCTSQVGARVIPHYKRDKRAIQRGISFFFYLFTYSVDNQSRREDVV